MTPDGKVPSEVGDTGAVRLGRNVLPFAGIPHLVHPCTFLEGANPRTVATSTYKCTRSPTESS